MPKRPITADDLLRLTMVGDPQFSPDGAEILFSVKTVNKKFKTVSNLVSVDLDGRLHEWTQGEDVCSNGRWSPDGASVAFVSNRVKPGSQIFALPTVGGEGKQLTNLPEGSIGGFKWSPNSRYIAFTFRAVEPEFTEAAKKDRETKGGSTPPLTVTSIYYRLDGDGTFGDARHKLYLLDVSTGEYRELYSGDGTGNFDYDWKPDSTELIVARSISARPLLDPINDQLFRVPLEGEPWMVPGKPAGPKHTPRWSPDGSQIAYIGHEDPMDGWGTRNSHVYVVPAEGGIHRDLMLGSDFDVDVMTLSDSKEALETFLAWAPDGNGLYLQLGWQGASELGFASIHGGVERITEGHHYIGLNSINPAGTDLAAIYGNPGQVPEIARVQASDGQTATLTSYNAWLAEEVELARPEEHWVESTGGANVHTWVMKPSTGYGTWPAILEVHGGPHTQYGWTFFHEMQLLVAQGYVVVYSNPRGSKGYGEAHTRSIHKAWGTVDWDDIESVTIWMQIQPFIDATRIGIMGGSYGGFMTNWAIGHSQAFKAAITDRCVSNLISACGNADFPFNALGNFGGLCYGDLGEVRQLWRQSPLAYFKGVTTPTLIIHSEGDLRCNIEQSEQVFSALQSQNVPSKFIRYPKETSHGMSRNGPADLRIHRLNEIVTWWEKWL
jgi:dipeptidyl aminopeptidase/acylaminoacyl peptidase